MIKRGIKILKIEADSNYEFGFKLGKSLKKEIKERIEKNKKIYWERSTNKNEYSKLVKKAKKFLPTIKKCFPNLLIEAEGLAKGSETSFDDILVLICDEEIVDFGFTKKDTKPKHCTTVALKTDDNQFLLGHNEDWFPEFRKNALFLVNGRIKNNKFLALGYIGCLAGSGGGINSSGVAYSDTSFYFSRFEYKVPRGIHLRALLDIKTPKQALNTLNCEASIISNTVFVFEKYGIVDIEELWNKEEIFNPRDWIVHTNHPILKRDRTKEHAKEEKESVIRYERANELLLKERKLNINTLKKILSDHKTDICGHLNKKHSKDITVTIASLIMNPKEKYILVCHGNPCKYKYKKYKL